MTRWIVCKRRPDGSLTLSGYREEEEPADNELMAEFNAKTKAIRAYLDQAWFDAASVRRAWLEDCDPVTVTLDWKGKPQ